MSLTSDLRRIVANIKTENLRKVYRLSMNDIGNQIITSSPRDQGTFQANWLSAINTGDYSIDETKTSVTDSQGRLTATVSTLDGFEEFYFTNSMPYDQKLEDGHSKFAPSGMVKIAVNDFPQIFAKNAALVSRL